MMMLERLGAGGGALIDLSRNESPYPVAMRSVWARMAALPVHRYPAFDAAPLREAAAAYYGCAPEEIVAGNGSSDIIDQIVAHFGGPDRLLLTTRPCFSMYPVYARAHRMRFADVPCRADLSLDEEAFLAAAAGLRPDLILLATPNNPTGASFSRDFVCRLRRAHPPATILVDEAYIEYGELAESCIALARADPQVAVTRTLSKIGYAGLRLGFLIASAGFIAELGATARPFRISDVTAFAGMAALAEREGNARRVAAVKAERARVRERAAPLVPEIFRSEGNFNVIRIAPRDFAPDLRLADMTIRLATFSFAAQNYLRVTVGRPEANDLFLEWLRRHGRALWGG